MREISDLIVHMSQDNPRWGYSRIQGALTNLKHKVGRGTIANVLKRNGIEPAPERSKHTSWSTFLRSHWRTLAASDFFTVEVWTGRGLVTQYVLFVISLADRIVTIAGITTRPDEPWILQIARNVTDPFTGVLNGKRHLIIDRDAKYSAQFRRLIRDSGIEAIRWAPKSPNLNAYAKRFVRSIKDECLSRMIFIGQASLRRALAEYMDHYHRERNHQGIGNRVICAPAVPESSGREVYRRARLGGLLNFYYHAAP
jgi:transposase InsO family protein